MEKAMHIAPCGMNCSLCLAFQRGEKNCPGCNSPDSNKSRHCRIKNCEELSQTKSGFCYSCTKYPCRRLKQLDTRYRTKYGMSMIQNLRIIEMQGIATFMERETITWTCATCGSLLCVHRVKCQNCGDRNEKFPGVAPSHGV